MIDTKNKYWLLFCIFAAIISAPAILFIYLFDGNARWGWLSNVSYGIIIAIAIIGAMGGFVKYIINKEPGPITTFRRRLGGEK